MTLDVLDDLDTWRVIYSQLVGANSKYAIIFALNNNPEAKNSCKVRIKTAEISQGNDTWDA